MRERWERLKKGGERELEIDGVIVDCRLALILDSQGSCLGALASFSLSYLWPCWGVDQTWHPIYHPVLLLSFQTWYPSPPSPSFICSLSYRCGLIPLSISHPPAFMSSPAVQTAKRAESSGEVETSGREGRLARVRGQSAAAKGQMRAKPSLPSPTPPTRASRSKVNQQKV